MSQLKAFEKVTLEKLFDRGGYVLNFTDRTFSEFFRENGIDIDNAKYQFNGASKMKRLRAFWEIESDEVVARVMSDLLKYANETGEVDSTDAAKATAIFSRLSGEKPNGVESHSTERDFLAQEFSQRLDLSGLQIDAPFQAAIEQRIGEIQKTLGAGAALAVIFLCGSTLEGLLLDAATKNVQQFNQAKSAPLDKNGNVRLLHDWPLECLINTAHEVGLLSLDVKKYGHALKDFRNYIHPRQQVVQKFSPDLHTAKISWQVLQAAVANLSGQRK